MTIADQPKWRDGAFGNADANRIDALATYIEITGVVPSVRIQSDQIRYRFIIGKKGAGKTHYLHALRQALSSSKAYVLKQIEAVPTDNVVQFNKAAQRFHAKLAEDTTIYVDPYFYIKEFWRIAWDRAIYCSVMSIIYRHYEHPTERSDFDLRKIPEDAWKRVRKFLPEAGLLQSPASALSAFMHRHTSFNRSRRFLYDPEWNYIKAFAERAVARLPPLVIIVDAIDDDFESAPEPWLYCQDGLFKSIIGQLNDSTGFSNRVHIIAAIRDVVYSSLFRSDHALRFVQDSHIFHIRWDYRTSRSFLFKKVQDVLKIQNDDSSNPVSAWLGIERVNNSARGILEPVVQYILRHTRMVPRDIVVMGNALAEGMSQRQLTSEEVTSTVHEVARALADESIRTAVNEALMSREYVSEILREIQQSLNKESSRGNPSSQVMKGIVLDIRASLNQQVDKFFRTLGTEVFSYSTLVDALIVSGLSVREDFDGSQNRPYRFDHILWRQGLLAYQDKYGDQGNWKFYNAGPFESFLLPEEEPAYGLHTILLDKYRSILTVTGGEPVF